MLQYMSKLIYFNNLNYGGNEDIKDNAALPSTAFSSSKRHSLDIQDSEILYKS